MVDLVADGTIRRVALAHRDPNKEHERARTRYARSIRSDLMSSVPHVIRRGRSDWNPKLSEQDLAAAAGRPGREGLLRRLGTKLQRLVGDLLDMASIDAGRLSFQPTVVDLGAILDDTCQALDASARAKGLHLKVVHPSEPVAIPADRPRILQFWPNLVGNAVKFSKRQERSC